MSDPRGFITIERIENRYRPVEERVHDFNEVETQLPEDIRRYQAARCMDCGVAFCHWGCPVGSLIPEWQDKLHHGDWKAAFDILQKTNNFPEFTGRLCPAPCESSCVLEINDDSVTIRENELAVIEHAFNAGYVQPKPPKTRTGKRVAVIGSGPAGMACADTLNKIGHSVVLFEAADQVGGLLRYGVPDFKLEKRVIDRRVDLMRQEGLEIRTNTRVGVDVPAESLLSDFDAVCIAIGARQPRDLAVPGRELDGIYFAMDYLEQQNKVVGGAAVPPDDRISAKGKHVVVLGGGDTGSDCVGTANRQGARSVTQIELLPPLPRHRPADQPWPLYARLYKTTSSHEEGCERLYNLQTQSFVADKQGRRVKKLVAVEVEWGKTGNGQHELHVVPGSEREIKADLVLLALGFVHVEQGGLVSDLGLALNPRGSIAVDDQFRTSVEGVFAAGDAHRGASLIVWAIQHGRQTAAAMDAYLRGR
ncbi:MAG: glutamate synthase subunit beta [Chloroflexi bacterium]|nr:glutamate synthase subunit beta [Chloroflexota bacterium]